MNIILKKLTQTLYPHLFNFKKLIIFLIKKYFISPVLSHSLNNSHKLNELSKKLVPESLSWSRKNHKTFFQASARTRRTPHQFWSARAEAREVGACKYRFRVARNRDLRVPRARSICHCSGYQPPPLAAARSSTDSLAARICPVACWLKVSQSLPAAPQTDAIEQPSCS